MTAMDTGLPLPRTARWREAAVVAAAGVLCLLGGIIGLIFGYGIGAIAASLIPGFPAEAYTPWWAIVLALGFSACVGVVFGMLPAAKAANLDPISSLRYE